MSFRFVFVFLLALLGSAAWVQAQPAVGLFDTTGINPEENILTCTLRKPGLYRSFAEFRSNRPSVSEGYVLEPVYAKQNGMQFLAGYDLKPAEGSALSKSELRKKIWGFCYRDSVYVNTTNFDDDGKAGQYRPMVELGRFAVVDFRATASRNKPSRVSFQPVGGIGMGVGVGMGFGTGVGFGGGGQSRQDAQVGVVLDMNTGLYQTITPKLMETLLADDFILQNDYKTGLEAAKTPFGRVQLQNRILHSYNEGHGDKVVFR